MDSRNSMEDDGMPLIFVLVSRHDVKKNCSFFNGMYYDGYLMLS